MHRLFLAALTGLLLALSPATALAAGDLDAVVTPTTLTEGQPVTVTITPKVSSGTTSFPAGASVSADLLANSFGVAARNLGSFPLPAGGTTHTFQFVIDDAVKQPITPSSVVVKFTVTGSTNTYVYPGSIGLTVADNDTTTPAPPAAGGTPPPAATTPAPAPAPGTGAPAPADGTQFSPEDLWPLVRPNYIRHKGRQLKFRFYFNDYFSGRVKLTSGGKTIGVRYVSGGDHESRTITMTVPKKHYRGVVRRGWSMTLRVAGLDRSDRAVWYTQRFE